MQITASRSVAVPSQSRFRPRRGGLHPCHTPKEKEVPRPETLDQYFRVCGRPGQKHCEIDRYVGYFPDRFHLSAV